MIVEQFLSQLPGAWRRYVIGDETTRTAARSSIRPAPDVEQYVAFAETHRLRDRANVFAHGTSTADFIAGHLELARTGRVATIYLGAGGPRGVRVHARLHDGDLVELGRGAGLRALETTGPYAPSPISDTSSTDLDRSDTVPHRRADGRHPLSSATSDGRIWRVALGWSAGATWGRGLLFESLRKQVV